MTHTPPGHGDRPRPRLSAASIASVPVGGLLLCTWFWASLALLVTGLSALPALGSGLLLVIPWLMVMEWAVGVERRRAVAVHGLRVILPAQRRSRRRGAAGWLQNRWFALGSGAYWRGILHHHLAILVTGLFFLAFAGLLWAGWSVAETALTAGPVELGGREISRPVLAGASAVCVLLSVSMLVLGALADRALARTLISGSEDDLREQVAELAERRQGAVDAAAQERLRIERDLHDGVQPRLVNLAMTLGIARHAIRQDPDRAERLVAEAHAEAKAVMTDLRQLARGIHPAVLTDRGLDAALSALAARSAIPVTLDVSLGGADVAPLDRERETVAYFVVAEALTNVAKHAGASRSEVTVTRDSEVLHVRVRDDGRGGARVHRDGRSTGLAGLTDRVRATGGVLELSSPPDGGTVLHAAIPLAPSPGEGRAAVRVLTPAASSAAASTSAAPTTASAATAAATPAAATTEETSR